MSKIISFTYNCLESSCSNRQLNIVNRYEEDGEKECLCPNCGVPMKLMGQKGATILGSKEQQYQKTVNHLKTRAKNHSQSPEAQYERRKNENKELKNYKGL